MRTSTAMTGTKPKELRYVMQRIMHATRKMADVERKGRWSIKMQENSMPFDSVVMFWRGK